MNRRLTCLLAVLALLFSCALADEAEFPLQDGFLTEGEFVYESDEDGVYRYLSPTLKVEIIRHYDQEENLTWTEAEVWTNGDMFDVIPAFPDKPMKSITHKKVEDIAQENKVVLACSSDFAFLRLSKNQRGGVIIRDGVVLCEEPRPSNSTVFPNLDTLALFPDGDMRVYNNREKKAADFLAMGATDVLSFGPVMVRDGVINEEDLAKYGIYREPRLGVGMFEIGHYMIIMVEGRQDDSRGVSVLTLAGMFQEKGCPTAFNLDGGQSATISFMGKQVIQVGNSKKDNASARNTNEVFAIGHSDQVSQE